MLLNGKKIKKRNLQGTVYCVLLPTEHWGNKIMMIDKSSGKKVWKKQLDSLHTKSVLHSSKVGYKEINKTNKRQPMRLALHKKSLIVLSAVRF